MAKSAWRNSGFGHKLHFAKGSAWRRWLWATSKIMNSQEPQNGGQFQSWTGTLTLSDSESICFVAQCRCCNACTKPVQNFGAVTVGQTEQVNMNRWALIRGQLIYRHSILQYVNAQAYLTYLVDKWTWSKLMQRGITSCLGTSIHPMGQGFPICPPSGEAYNLQTT